MPIPKRFEKNDLNCEPEYWAIRNIVAGPTAKLVYIASQHRVKVELSRAICMAAEMPPDDLFKRAITKLESVQDKGEIIAFEIFEDRIRKVWEKIRETPDLDPNRMIVMTLAIGTPELKGLEVKESVNEKALVDITITASQRDVAKWFCGWVRLTINREIMKLGISASANASQIKGATMRAITGQKVEDLSISALPEMPSEEEIKEKPYSLVANKARKEVSLIVRDVKALIEKLNTTGVVDLANKSSKKLESQTGDKYRVLKSEIIDSVESIINGPELLGFDMPVVILCAVGADAVEQNPEKEKEKRKDTELGVQVSEDKMIATITDFSMDIYDSKTMLDRKWFGKQLKNFGFPKPSFLPQLDSLVEAAGRKEDLTGCIVSEGKMPVNGSDPYLFDSLSEAENDEIDFDNDVLDIRGMQQKTLCTPGTLVAEIRYNEPAEDGVDVWGTPIYATIPDDFEVLVGEGIQQQGGGKFYATFDGVSIIEGNKVALSKVMIHKGEVNLRTGNISFDGPVEIQGSVDSGAVVEASGDITIIGNVRGAKIKSGGSIIIKGGVITGEFGRLDAKGDIRAEFIENSNVHCEGSLIAKKAIINTTAIVGHNIEVLNKTDGILAGGYLTCRNNVLAPNLGFKRGAMTKLKIGVDWKIERAVLIRSARLERVTECQKKDRLEMRQIAGKRKSQMTRKHNERKAALLERVRKARSITDKLEEQLGAYRSKLSFNMESIIFVSGALSNNLEINIGGVNIAIPQDLAGVGILAKRKRGSHILPIEEAERLGHAMKAS